MNTKWLKGYKGQERETRKQEILSNYRVLEILDEILETKKPSTPDYESSGWAYQAADLNGYNRAIDEIKKLINIKE